MLRQARGMVTLTVRRNRTQVLVPVSILVSVYILCQLNSSVYAHLPRSTCPGLIITGLMMQSIYCKNASSLVSNVSLILTSSFFSHLQQTIAHQRKPLHHSPQSRRGRRMQALQHTQKRVYSPHHISRFHLPHPPLPPPHLLPNLPPHPPPHLLPHLTLHLGSHC